jgi:hypothetical protein
MWFIAAYVEERQKQVLGGRVMVGVESLPGCLIIAPSPADCLAAARPKRRPPGFAAAG